MEKILDYVQIMIRLRYWVVKRRIRHWFDINRRKYGKKN